VLEGRAVLGGKEQLVAQIAQFAKVFTVELNLYLLILSVAD
jgi:hypothetical protein